MNLSDLSDLYLGCHRFSDHNYADRSFYVHINDPSMKQEMGLHYLLVYAVLLFDGSGKYSADYVLVRQRA